MQSVGPEYLRFRACSLPFMLGVWGLGFGGWGLRLGFGVCGLGFGVGGWGLGVGGWGLWVPGLSFTDGLQHQTQLDTQIAPSTPIRVSGFGFRVSGFRFRGARRTPIQAPLILRFIQLSPIPSPKG